MICDRAEGFDQGLLTMPGVQRLFSQSHIVPNEDRARLMSKEI